MDYIPVYDGDEPRKGRRSRSASTRLQKLGVRTERRQLRSMTRTVRAVGTLEVDERGVDDRQPEVRGLDQNAHREHDRPDGHGAGAAARGLQPGSGHRAAGIPGCLARRCSRWRECDPGSAGQHAVARGRRSAAPAQLGHRRGGPSRTAGGRGRQRNRCCCARRRTASCIEKRRRQACASCRARCSTRSRTCRPCGCSPDVFEQDLALVRPGQAAAISVAAYPGRTFTGQGDFRLPDGRTGDAHGAGPHRVAERGRAAEARPCMAPSRSRPGRRGRSRGSRIRRAGLRHASGRADRSGGGAFEPREVELGLRAATATSRWSRACSRANRSSSTAIS